MPMFIYSRRLFVCLCLRSKHGGGLLVIQQLNGSFIWETRKVVSALIRDFLIQVA